MDFYSSRRFNVALKGFSNGWGESNCFLNSALQIL